MFKHTDKKDIFVSNIKIEKQNINKQTPRINTKISAYDRTVQLVTNTSNDSNEPEPKKKVHIKV